MQQSFDPTNGGFGRAPKFPQAHMLQFLLRYAYRSGEAQATRMVETTLDHMARGGIDDQLGGGFHRYSTDAQWRVPHFEKMLYDQAIDARAYLEAAQATGSAADAEVARQIFAYVLRDLTAPSGGFYAAEDADSEGEEGRFYTWSRAEIIAVLGAPSGGLDCRLLRCDRQGVLPGGRSPLSIPLPLDAFVKLHRLDAAAIREDGGGGAPEAAGGAQSPAASAARRQDHHRVERVDDLQPRVRQRRAGRSALCRGGGAGRRLRAEPPAARRPAAAQLPRRPVDDARLSRRLRVLHPRPQRPVHRHPRGALAARGGPADARHAPPVSPTPVAAACATAPRTTKR